MHKALKTFFGEPTLLQATGFLRSVFALSFAAQLLFALLLTLVLFVLTGKRSDNPLLAQIMIVLALLQLPLSLFISHLVAKAANRQAYLSAAIMAGVLLSTPAWFAAMAFLSTTQSFYLLFFLVILMNYYALGFFLCGRWGKHVPNLPVVTEREHNHLDSGNRES